MRPPRQHTSLDHLTTHGRSRAVRLPECDYAGDEIIHVTVCARCGEPFRDHHLAQLVSESVEFYCPKLGYRRGPLRVTGCARARAATRERPREGVGRYA